jgi:hypothetical protein
MGRLLKKKPSKANKKKTTKSALGKLLEDTPILEKGKLTESLDEEDLQETKANHYAQMYGTFKEFKGSVHHETREGVIVKPMSVPSDQLKWDRKQAKYRIIPGPPKLSAEPSDPPVYPNEVVEEIHFPGEVEWHDPNDLVVPSDEYIAGVRAHEEFTINPSHTPLYIDSEAKIDVTSMGDKERQYIHDAVNDELELRAGWKNAFEEPEQHGIGSVRAKILNQYLGEGSMEARHHMSTLFSNALMGGYWHEMSPEQADVLIEWCRNNLEPGREGSCIDFWEDI